MLCSGEAQVLQQHQLSGCTPTLRSFLLVCKVLEDMGGGGGYAAAPPICPVHPALVCQAARVCLVSIGRAVLSHLGGGWWESCRRTLRGGLTAADSGSAVRTHALLLVITVFSCPPSSVCWSFVPSGRGVWTGCWRVAGSVGAQPRCTWPAVCWERVSVCPDPGKAMRNLKERSVNQNGLFPNGER